MNRAARLCYRADVHEEEAVALEGTADAAHACAQHRAAAARHRRAAAHLISAAAQITDWRDGLDRLDSSWLSRLSHLVSADPRQ